MRPLSEDHEGALCRERAPGHHADREMRGRNCTKCIIVIRPIYSEPFGIRCNEAQPDLREEAGKAYRHDMEWARRYAHANRVAMMNLTLEMLMDLEEELGLE